jgi:hypothetical protein
MQRYFFHTQTGTRTTDLLGLELAGPVEARSEAIKACGVMMSETPEGFWGTRPWNVTVTDEAGLVLWEIFMDGVETRARA